MSTAVLNASQASYLNSGDPDTPYAFLGRLILGYEENFGATAVGILQFDLSSIPATAHITSVDLALHCTYSNGQGDYAPRACSAYPSTDITWDSTATWNNFDFASVGAQCAAFNIAFAGAFDLTDSRLTHAVQLALPYRAMTVFFSQDNGGSNFTNVVIKSSIGDGDQPVFTINYTLGARRQTIINWQD